MKKLILVLMILFMATSVLAKDTDEKEIKEMWKADKKILLKEKEKLDNEIKKIEKRIDDIDAFVGSE